MRVVHDIEECGKLWNEFSPHKSVFDTWDFRKSFVEGFRFKLHFIHIDDRKNKGLLPLWYDDDEMKYTFVGADWPEDNTFFAASIGTVKSLIDAAPRPLELCAIIPFDGMDELSKLGTFKQDQYLKYVLPLEKDEAFDHLLSRFAKKYRYNLRYDYKKIMAQDAKIEWIETNDPEYFDRYVDMKSIVFDGDTEDDGNFYLHPPRRETFRRVMKNAKEYKVRVMQITIGGKLAGIDIVIVYNGTYYMIGGAYDVKNYSGVGNAALYLLFEDAIRQKSTLIDCLQEDSGWKHRYFEGRPLYIFSAP